LRANGDGILKIGRKLGIGTSKRAARRLKACIRDAEN
jgi:hypothetical protein